MMQNQQELFWKRIILLKESLKHKKIQQIPLSDECKAILLGSILGDGSLKISKSYRNARFSMRHSVSQEAYFYWKVKKLREISTDNAVHVQEPDGFSKKSKLHYQSRALISLTQLYEIVSADNKLKIQRRWLNHLTPLSLMIWWLDDGSIIGSGKKGVLCTDAFDLKSVQLLANYLAKVWKIHVRIGVIRRRRPDRNVPETEVYRLWFSCSELKKFLKLILPSIPVSQMIYKTMVLYKDPQLQQRWISEMKSALPQFEKEIDLLCQGPHT
jgi:hypothetical protein